MAIQSIGTPALWIGFIAFVLAMLVLDLLVFHRHAHAVRMREAAVWTLVWIALALIFNLGVYHWFGTEHALEFLAGYLIEKSLSVDNLFVFYVLFSYFKVPAHHQHRVLFWGILGALITRAAFIVLGTVMIQSFHWIIYLFGAFLVYTGIKLLAGSDEMEVEPEKNSVLRVFRRMVPSVSDYRDHHFTVVENGRRFATPLLAVLLVVEATDVVFAVDSIPAVFAVTTDPFIVFTSNIFAILGLRALYFVIAGMVASFHYLRAGLGLVLAFVGVKMLIADLYKLPIAISLGVIATLITGAIVASVLRPLADDEEPEPTADAPEAPEASAAKPPLADIDPGVSLPGAGPLGDALVALQADAAKRLKPRDRAD
jgi:tellurite resistance protein TerC